MAGYFESMVMERLSKFQAKANRAAQKAAMEVGKDADKHAFESVLPELKENVTVAYLNATAMWYRAYIPKKYNRTYGFYGDLDIQTPGDMTFGWTYLDQDMNKPSWGGGSYNIYDRVFLGGRHGGPVRGHRPARTTPIPAILEKSLKDIQAYIQNRIDYFGQQYFQDHFEQRCSEILKNM